MRNSLGRLLGVCVFAVSAGAHAWRAGDIDFPASRANLSVFGLGFSKKDDRPSYGLRATFSYQEEFLKNFWVGFELGGARGSDDFFSAQLLVKMDYLHFRNFEVGSSFGFAASERSRNDFYASAYQQNYMDDSLEWKSFYLSVRESWRFTSRWSLTAEMSMLFGDPFGVLFLAGINHTW